MSNHKRINPDPAPKVEHTHPVTSVGNNPRYGVPAYQLIRCPKCAPHNYARRFAKHRATDRIVVGNLRVSGGVQ